MGIKFLKFQSIQGENSIMKKQLEQLSAYEPGLSPEALKNKYGIERELFKLASNENLYGPTPKVKKQLNST